MKVVKENEVSQRHILIQFDPQHQRLEFTQNEEKIQLDENHYMPHFFAKDIEELRNNPESRKALKTFNLFSQTSQNPRVNLVKLQNQ